MVDEIAKQVGSRPNRKYQPLTDEAKAKMTELEIKNYEDKAKEGLLFGDTLLRGLSDKLRFVFSGVANGQTLENMGLTISGSYSEMVKFHLMRRNLRKPWNGILSRYSACLQVQWMERDRMALWQGCPGYLTYMPRLMDSPKEV